MKRRPPDFARLLQLVRKGERQADLARRLAITPAAVSAGITRARRLERLGLLGAGAGAIAAAAEETGISRSAVAALLAAAGRWKGRAEDVPDSAKFMRSVRSGFDWKSVFHKPSAAIAALRKAAAARAHARPIPGDSGTIAAALAERERGRLDSRALAQALSLPGALDEDCLRYAAVAGAVLACDLALGHRAAELRVHAAIVERVRAAPDRSTTALARELRTTRWRVAVARCAIAALPQIEIAMKERLR